MATDLPSWCFSGVGVGKGNENLWYSFLRWKPGPNPVCKCEQQASKDGRERALDSLTPGQPVPMISMPWPGPRYDPQNCLPLQVSGAGRNFLPLPAMGDSLQQPRTGRPRGEMHPVLECIFHQSWRCVSRRRVGGPAGSVWASAQPAVGFSKTCRRSFIRRDSPKPPASLPPPT